MNKNILKSIWSILAGFLAVIILSIVSDMVIGHFMGTPPLVIAFIYRSLYTILGGYITASLAPTRPMKHIIIAMIIGGILGVLGAIGNWKLGTHWYPVAIAMTGPIFVFLGGELKIKKL